MNDIQNTDQFQPFIKLRSKSGTESVHYSALYEGLPDEFRLMAKEELNETEENIKIGIRRLKEVTKNEKLDLLEDNLLLAVLRSCKFNLKKSEAKLKIFVPHRRAIVKEVGKVEMADVEKVIGDMAVGMLPYRDKHGRLIFLTRPDGMHFEDYSIEDGATVSLALVLFQLNFQLTTVSGVTYLAECKTPSIYIFYPIFRMFRQCMSAVLSLPLRIARVEIVNEIALVRWLSKILRPFIPAKIYGRIHFNGSGYDKLHEIYPPDLLPEEFGGTRGPMTSKLYSEKFMDFIRELKVEAQRMESANGHHSPL